MQNSVIMGHSTDEIISIASRFLSDQRSTESPGHTTACTVCTDESDTNYDALPLGIGQCDFYFSAIASAFKTLIQSCGRFISGINHLLRPIGIYIS